MSRYGKVFLVLGLVWLIAAGVIFWSRSALPTAQSLEKYVTTHPIATASNRQDVIKRTADQLNRLSFEERRSLEGKGTLRSFFEELNHDERQQFLEMTLPEGFNQLMQALNKMTPERRKKAVERALENIRDGRPEGNDGPKLEDAQVQKIISQGLSSFYEEASPDVKLDFAPVIEELQRSTQNLR